MLRGPREPSPVTAALGSAVSPRIPEQAEVTDSSYPGLLAYSGVAVLAIVVFDVYQFSNVDHFLYAGTPAFTVLNFLSAAVPGVFVLIGFLLFEPAARSMIAGESRAVPHRLGRRAADVLPVYYVVIIVVWFSRQRGLPGDWRDLVEHLTFTQVFDGKRIFYTDGPAWAVSVTVLFYLTLTAFTFLIGKVCQRLSTRAARVVALAIGTTALGAVSVLWKAWSYAHSHRPLDGSFTTWFGPQAHFDEFATGMAIAIVVAGVGSSYRIERRNGRLLGLAALVILGLAAVYGNGGGWPAVYFSTTCAVGFALLLATAVLRSDSGPSTTPTGCLAWIGAIGYSTYLWHEPVLLALHGWPTGVRQAPGAFIQNAITVTCASLAVGWISYTVMQRPVQRLYRSLHA